MPGLTGDLKQLFSHGVLERFDRLQEADVQFTYSPTDVYLSCFSSAMELAADAEPLGVSPTLLKYAQALERFVVDPHTPIDPVRAAMVSATIYWVAGYTANSTVIARRVLGSDRPLSPSETDLASLLAHTTTLPEGPIQGLSGFFGTGDRAALEQSRSLIEERQARFLAEGDQRDYVTNSLLRMVLDGLEVRSFWHYVREHSTASVEDWRGYADALAPVEPVARELWPSQRRAIEAGLLDGRSSLVIRTPTSSGKTKLTEFAFANDLLTDPTRRCLYLAPFRALVTEVESSLGQRLALANFAVASLYGGSEANALEARLNEVASVVIATPEKMAAVLSYSGATLSEFHTVVIDEGHLLDSRSRGAAFEIQLARLRPLLADTNRVIFLSAVLPNAGDIAGWLVRDSRLLVDEHWQPATSRIGLVRWPKGGAARLRYLSGTSEPLLDEFFVPRVFEATEWRERSEETGRLRTHRFPQRGDNGSIAAALAFRAVASGPVIIFASRPDWATGIARRILARLALNRPIETNLVTDENEEALAQLREFLATVVGEESVVARAAGAGFAIHHSGVPQAARLVIEDAFRSQTLRLLIATNTIAQGVNFPARTVIVHSFPQTDAPVRDFWNLAGRAGRAMMETEGDVIILATGSLRPSTLRRFLDPRRIEPAESTILQLVRQVLEQYPAVTNETLAAIGEDEERDFSDVLRAIDSELLQRTLEDVALEDFDVGSVVTDLLATHQATALDALDGTDLAAAVWSLFDVRRTRLADRIPETPRRRLFARSGLSVDGSEAIEAQLEDLWEVLGPDTPLNRESLSRLFEALSRAPEAQGLDPKKAAAVAETWIRSGTYAAVHHEHGGAVGDLDAVVKFIDQEICYRIPWVLTGLLRLAETDAAPEGIEPVDGLDWLLGDVVGPARFPDWLGALPDFLRYGVDDETLVWVNSMGLPTRGYAQWVIDRFREANGAVPANIGALVAWLVESADALAGDSDAAWPEFFSRTLRATATRYRRIQALLEEF